MGYKLSAIKGMSWIGAFRFLTRIISLIRTIIIARILTPGQFGTFGIIAIVLSFVEIVTETGINVFLIQQKEKSYSYISTAWIISILRGFLIAVILLLTRTIIVRFYDNPDLYFLLTLGASIPLIRGFINPSAALFLKDLQYNKEFVYKTSVFFVESVTGIFVVLVLSSPVGLVWGLIIGAFYEVVLSFLMAKPYPQLLFDFQQFKAIIKKGKWLTAAGIFNYLYQNADTIIVGKLLGTVSLGLYDMAYKISLLPLTEVSDVVTKATFPVYLKIAHDQDRLRRAYVKTTAAIMICVVPIGIIFFFSSYRIVSLLLGPQWLAVAPILQSLILFGVIRSISYPTSALFLSVERQKYVAVITVSSLLVLLAVIIPFIHRWGIIGAGIAAIVSSLVTLPITGYFLYKILKK